MFPGHETPDLPDSHYLDNRIFTDATIFAQERKEIFEKVWRTGVSQSCAPHLYHDQRLDVWTSDFVFKLPTGDLVQIDLLRPGRGHS